jgi:NADH-quinone oxidoreductase subunit N
MATATKAAALIVFLRFFDVAAIGAQDTWAPLVAAVAAITIIVGNVGALGQTSLKRMLGYSGVAQAGYMLSGVVVGTTLGIQATVLYLLAYLAMNLAPFAVVVAVEREQPELRDDITALSGLGARNPWLAWPMTIGMLALAGIPGTVGFIAKFQLIHALVNGDYTWLAIVLVVGSMISLGYYLRVVATIWMRPALTTRRGVAPELAPMAGGSQEADASGEVPGASQEADASRELPGGSPAGHASADVPGSVEDASVGAAAEAPTLHFEVAYVALAFAAAVIFFGIFPSPLFHFAAHAGHAIAGLF